MTTTDPHELTGDHEVVRVLPPLDPAVRARRDELNQVYVPTPVPGGRVGGFLLPNIGGVVCVVLLPLGLLVHVPVLAWVLTFAVWLLNRLGQLGVDLMVRGRPKVMAVGAAGFGMMLRVWVSALALFLVGAQLHAGSATIGAGRRDLALPAMLLFLVVLTFDIGVRSVLELRRYRSDVATPEVPA